MADPPPQQQGKFTPGAAREALRFLRKAGKGSLLVTSGLKDVRLVLTGRQVTLEAEGFEIYGEESRDLVRTFLCAIFWEEPSFFLNPNGTTGTTASATLTVQGSSFELLSLMDRGLTGLMPIHQRVPGVDLLVTVGGDPPPDDVKSHTANLFRILSRTPNGGHLAIASEQAGLDVIDAAWSVSDLMDASQATVRRPPGNMSLRRLAHAEALAEHGLEPAVRFLHLAKAFTRSDPPRAARNYQEAASAFLMSGHAEQAQLAYNACLQLDQDNVAALEGLASALEELKRDSDGKRIRERLIKLYLRWGMPARARVQLEKITQPNAEQLELLLNTMLLTGDFPAATALAKRLVDGLDAESRHRLAARFAKSGARGKDLDRIVTLCGLHSLGPVKKIVKALSFIALLLVIVLLGELYVRHQFTGIAAAAETECKEGQFTEASKRWKSLDDLDLLVGASARDLPVTALTTVGSVTKNLRQLEDDVAFLSKPENTELRQLLESWQDASNIESRDIATEYKLLIELQEKAKSPQLKKRVQDALDTIGAFRQEAEEEVQKFGTLAARLQAAQVLLKKYRAVRQYGDKPDLLANLTLGVKVQVWPKDGQLSQRVGDEPWKLVGRRKAGQLTDQWELKIPLTQGDEPIQLRAEKKDHAPQEVSVKIVDLEDPTVEFRLLSSVTNDKLEQPLLLPGTLVRYVEKKSGAFDIDVRKACKLSRGDPLPAFPAEDAEGERFAKLLREQLGEAHPELEEQGRFVIQLQVENKANQWGVKSIYVTEVTVWLVEPNRDEGGAVPRVITNTGKFQQSGAERKIVKPEAGEGWVITPLDAIKDEDRRRRLHEAIVWTVDQMLQEAKR